MKSDYYRLPIYNPIEILSYDGGSHWFIKLPYKTILGYSEFNYIKELVLTDSVLVLKSNDLGFTYEGKNYCPSWLIINFKNKTEKILLSQQEFEKEMQNLKLNSFKLKNIDTLFKEFDSKKDEKGEWHLDKIN
ncbi:MAG: hypothetical protein Q8L81_10365 [Bacteroidota bacterium]|nr:hypothetical protein [Bacteroidota bacterium]